MYTLNPIFNILTICILYYYVSKLKKNEHIKLNKKSA